MSTLKNRIMLRVYALFALRFALSPLGLRALGLLAAIFTISLSVSVRHVLRNMPAPYDLPALLAFHTEAFLNTSLLVQVATLAGIALCLFVVRDAFKVASGRLSF
ncbi:MAG TPA: hypothetical protein VD967_02580 [Candidatus Paceibacterota bacterium]|nr:hypothetical protein [Candidatus Paceibacterota bacterium]